MTPSTINANAITHGGEMTRPYSPLQYGKCHNDEDGECKVVAAAAASGDDGLIIVRLTFSPILATRGIVPIVARFLSAVHARRMPDLILD